MVRIDISEDILTQENQKLLSVLLKDRTTNKSIVWATHSYECLGIGFGAADSMTPKRITGVYANLIQPRSEKSKAEQKDRTKVRAEVFTPTWLVKLQNGYMEDELAGKSLEEYIDTRWLEITCGEAPYMVSRYNAVTGEEVPLEERVGFLDRKLQRISREVSDEFDFFQLAIRAYQASYGYEYQGDSLLLARENLLASFDDYYVAKFHHAPSLAQKNKIATILSYNVFQMNGLQKTTPFSATVPKDVQLSLFEEIAEPDTMPTFKETKIKDWKTGKMIVFQRLSSKESEMKFDVVIGNPPYQEELQGTSDKPIYNDFIDESIKISDKSILITPARYLFNAGKTPKAWNQKMLSNPHFKVNFYEQDSSKIFPGTDIKGGVAITYHDTSKNFGAIGTFTAFTELNSILQKVIHKEDFQTIMPIIYLQNRFDLNKVYDKFPEYKKIIGSQGKEKRLTTSIFTQLPLFTEEQQEATDIKILGLINNKRVYKYINRNFLEAHPNIDKYKVILPSSNGSGSIGEVLSTPLVGTPLVGTPLVGYTQTFLSFGAFGNQKNAENCLKYIRTKFARAMLGTLKITQHNFKETWKNVPLQDFTVNSDIDWSQSVADIDRQLYKKYGLSVEEIAFIESKVREME
ncbi:Eco57I restriction-modification methylase domain-containing protein [Aerococcaceae bacterium zg-ZJ1578]|uniref:Eco57I restriction-modification methylase domain-containing protein n=1 Tax=Aerococcaceae bacterium zg-252 TaxID=2796928 RepID=UPI001A2F5DD9|nr:Eco57I restriction-modification methylase domain-containing protein [Aerococcaceae bacterium zg-1578]